MAGRSRSENANSLSASWTDSSGQWVPVADSADGALPVIILDGFDELLQATGVDRSDYLERVQEFQQQQEAMGLPVVVIITTRTVVADRARFPQGTTAIKLDPFDEPRISRLVGIWNRANARTANGDGDSNGALTTEAVLRYRDLAEQPLLLMMLLIYDAEDGALRHTDRHLTHGELYERLLAMFARREVDKHHSGLGRDDLAEAVEGELRRLEVAQQMAAHESSRTTGLYDRRGDDVSLDEVEKICGPPDMPSSGVPMEPAMMSNSVTPASANLPSMRSTSDTLATLRAAMCGTGRIPCASSELVASTRSENGACGSAVRKTRVPSGSHSLHRSGFLRTSRGVISTLNSAVSDRTTSARLRRWTHSGRWRGRSAGPFRISFAPLLTPTSTVH
jgi:hypothetical protein